jgi:hypothetical protein
MPAIDFTHLRLSRPSLKSSVANVVFNGSQIKQIAHRNFNFGYLEHRSTGQKKSYNYLRLIGQVQAFRRASVQISH